MKKEGGGLRRVLLPRAVCSDLPAIHIITHRTKRTLQPYSPPMRLHHEPAKKKSLARELSFHRPFFASWAEGGGRWRSCPVPVARCCCRVAGEPAAQSGR